MTDHYAGSASVRNEEANGGRVKQVGGNHYEADYQHWDWVADADLGYFEANATKYLSRWWKKNGAQDVEKAYSYVKKTYTLLAERRYHNMSKHVSPYQQDRHHAEKCLTKFLDSAQVSPLERGIIHAIAHWRSDIDLIMIMREIDVLYMDASAGATLAPPPLAPTIPPTGQEGHNRPAHGAADKWAGSTQGKRAAVDGQEHPFGYDAEEEQ